jgi:hypothetical protein
MRASRLIVVAVAVTVLGGCSWSSDQGKKISPAGSSYSYKVPHGWLIVRSGIPTVEGRSYQTAVHGQDGLATVAVSQQTISQKITPRNLSAIEQEYQREAAKWQFPPVSWRKTTLAGAPALSYHQDGKTREGKSERVDSYVAFKGRRLFYVECIYDDDTSADVSHACAEVSRSLVLN